MRAHETKRWSVNAVSEGHAPVQYFCDGRPLTQTSAATVDNVSPVEHLLIAIAGCFALSCRAVIAKRKLSQVSFEIIASGEKAAAPPNRLAQISVGALFRGSISEPEAVAISEEAKPLCTVSNSFLASPDFIYSSRTIKEYGPPARDTHPPQVSH